MKKALFALSALLLAAVSCYNASDLETKVNDLDKRVSVLEEKVKELNEKTVPGLQATVAAVQAGVTVSSVAKTANGYTIVFSNGTTAVIADGNNGTNGTNGEKGDKGDTPVISAKMDNGEFYWTVDGEFMKDAEGNKIPVHAATPQFRINEGKWEISYDGGTSWAVVDRMGSAETGSITIEDKEDVVIFWIGETPYTVQKESAFRLVINNTKDLGVPAGVTLSIPYKVEGAKEGDEVEVEILNVIGDWTATLTRTSDVAGTIKVTPSSETVTDGKVFVYAANGNGKTDIKCLYFEEGKLSVITEAKQVTMPAEGGEFNIAVETNMSYTLSGTNGSSKWIDLAKKGATKATHVDSLVLIVSANTSVASRSTQISVLNPATWEAVYTVDILQAGTAGLDTKYEDYIGRWICGENLVTVTSKTDSTYNITGLYTIGTKYGSSTAEACFDKRTGDIYVMEQAVGTWVNGSSGAATTYLCGIFTSNNKYYPHFTGTYNANSKVPYELFRGNIKDGVASFVAGLSKLNTPFNAYCIRWGYDAKNTTGNYLYNKVDNNATPPTIAISNLPFEMKKAQEASDEYKSWIGQYELKGKYGSKSDSTFVMSVLENIPNESYIVNGLGVDGANLYFDSESGNPVFKYEKFSGTSTYEFYMAGITTDSYISEGNANKVIATMKKAEDGSITIVSDPWDISDTRKNVSTATLGIIGYKTAESKWVTFSDCFMITLPAAVQRTTKTASCQICSAYTEEIEAACEE